MNAARFGLPYLLAAAGGLAVAIMGLQMQGQETSISRWTPPQSHGIPPAEDCTPANPGEQVWNIDEPGVFWICAPFDPRWVEFKIFEAFPREPRIDADDPNALPVDPPEEPPPDDLSDGRS